MLRAAVAGAIFLVSVGIARASPPAALAPPLLEMPMADTLPYGNRFGVPFTEEEYRWAMRLLFPTQEAERQVRVVYDPDPEAVGVSVTDGTLLVLAAHSGEAAGRVVRYRPHLADKVKMVRADPQRAIDSLRRDPDPDRDP